MGRRPRPDRPRLGAEQSLGEQKLIGEHMAYLGRLMEAGEVTQAGGLFAPDHGPAEDGLVALILYAVDAARARVIADTDPAVGAGLITLDIRPLVHRGLSRCR